MRRLDAMAEKLANKYNSDQLTDKLNKQLEQLDTYKQDNRSLALKIQETERLIKSIVMARKKLKGEETHE